MDKRVKTEKENNKKRLYTIIAAIAAVIVLTIIIIIVVFFDPTPKIDGVKVDKNFQFLLEEESTEVDNFSVYSAQNTLFTNYLKIFRDEKHGLDNPMVIVNPFFISPQTALMFFTTEKAEQVEITIKGKHGDDIVRTYEKSKEHIIPLLGLYGDYTNKVVIKTESGNVQTVDVKIELENAAGPADVIKNDIKNSNGEFYFTTSAYGASTLAYDNYGETRWYLNTGYSKGMVMLSNGNILLSSDAAGPDVTSAGGVVEVDMLGFVRKEYAVEGGYHHDAYEMKNGNLLILTNDIKSTSFADYIVELDRTTGKVVKEWKLKEICDKIDNTVSGFYPTWGWINSITYDYEHDDLILSLRNMNSVMSLDYETSEINWILGEKKYWTDKYDKYLIKGMGRDFIYPAGQHSVNITEEGYLSIFNNGYDAHDEEEQSCKSLQDNASWAMTYNIDPVNKTAQVMWKFGGQEYFSYALSSYTYASDGHTVFNSGWHFSKDTKYDDPSCTQFSNDHYDTHLIEFDENKNIVVQLYIYESKFEIVKADIYNLAKESVNGSKKTTLENYNAELATTYTTIEQNYEILDKKEAMSYAENFTRDFSFGVNTGKFITKISALSYETIDVIFIDLQGKAYKFNVKEKDGDVKDVYINTLPPARYYIYLDYNGVKYNTLHHIVID